MAAAARRSARRPWRPRLAVALAVVVACAAVLVVVRAAPENDERAVGAGAAPVAADPLAAAFGVFATPSESPPLRRR